MIEPTFYALFLVDETGAVGLAGAFESRESAEGRGKARGGRFEIRAAIL